jgi:hypothetical protein
MKPSSNQDWLEEGFLYELLLILLTGLILPGQMDG